MIQIVSDEVLKELAHLFPATTLIHALELIDKDKIIKYIGNTSKRELFAVKPSSGVGVGRYKQRSRTYKCISHCYCTCQSFSMSVISKKEFRYCKHLLAVILADALDCYSIINVPDTELGQLLLDEETTIIIR